MIKRLFLLFLIVALLAPAFGAITAATTWEVRTGGSDTNGGGYSTGGTNLSLFNNKNAASCTSCQSSTVNISTTDGVTAGTTTITSVSGNYSSALIGNVVYISGGTGSITAAWYQVVTVPGATSFTVDRSTGLTAGTGVTVNIGGALNSPGQVAALMVNGNAAYIKNDASVFAFTTASTNVAAGAINLNATVSFCGYATTRTCSNTDSAPTWQDQASTMTMFANGFGSVYNIIFDGNSQTAAKAVTGAYCVHCTFKNFNTASTGVFNCYNCYATGNSAAVLTVVLCNICEAGSNTATPLIGNGGSSACLFCLSHDNSGSTTDGISGFSLVSQCSTYNNGRDGVSSALNTVGFLNCASESNGRYGYNLSGNSNGQFLINSSTFGNMTATNGTFTAIGSITSSSSVYVAPASRNFALNNTASAGKALRAGAYPGAFPDGTTTSYQDVGAIQHQDPANVTIGSPLIQ